MDSWISPTVLYTDCDCCNSDGPSKFQVLFHKWDLCVRLDIWHYMQRLASGCSTGSHPLYGTFMSCLSAAIFEWDREDFELLLSAKKAEMIAAGITVPSTTAVQKAISKDELAKHCRRRTRGVKETTAPLLLCSHRHSWCTPSEGGDEDYLDRAVEACQLHPGSTRGGAVHHHRSPKERLCDATGLQVCSWRNIIGKLPPPSHKVCAWIFCWCS